MRTCQWCGSRFDNATAGQRSSTGYCSEKCVVAARGAGKGPMRGSPENMARTIRLIGIVFTALTALITLLCYKFPKFLMKKKIKSFCMHILLLGQFLLLVR
jgi:hypothetical protein